MVGGGPFNLEPGQWTDDTSMAVCLATSLIDGTGIGGPIADSLKRLGFKQRVMEVQFANKSPDRKYANMRSFMWGRLRDWLSYGAIDAGAALEADLTGPGYHHDRQDRVLLEKKDDMKKRGLASPDHGDALAMTFCAAVGTNRGLRRVQPRNVEPDRATQGLGWMG
jgi:hypothetical protein